MSTYTAGYSAYGGDPDLPFDSRVAGVRDRALEVAAEGRRVGQPAPRLSDEDVMRFLREGGGIVAAAIGAVGYTRLPARDTPSLPAGAFTSDDVVDAARGLTEMYAASMLLDATRPQANGGDGGGKTLYARFDNELKRLSAAVALALKPAEDGSGPVGVPVAAPAYWLPPRRVIGPRTGF